MSEYTEIDYDRCIHTTDGAVLVLIGDKQRWIPRSVLDPDENQPTDLDEGGELYVAVWFAEKEGLV